MSRKISSAAREAAWTKASHAMPPAHREKIASAFFAASARETIIFPVTQEKIR
jgi:hypothetical protein